MGGGQALGDDDGAPSGKDDFSPSTDSERGSALPLHANADASVPSPPLLPTLSQHEPSSSAETVEAEEKGRSDRPAQLAKVQDPDKLAYTKYLQRRLPDERRTVHPDPLITPPLPIDDTDPPPVDIRIDDSWVTPPDGPPPQAFPLDDDVMTVDPPGWADGPPIGPSFPASLSGPGDVAEGYVPPGLLPSALLLASMVHEVGHTLWQVDLDVEPASVLNSSPPSQQPATASEEQTTASLTGGAEDSDGYHPPTKEEILASKPHPHAFFCTECVEWVVVLPACAMLHDEPRPDPEQVCGSHTGNEAPTGEGSPGVGRWAGRKGPTHHYHTQPVDIEASRLRIPISLSEEFSFDIEQLTTPAPEGDTQTPQGDLIDLNTPPSPVAPDPSQPAQAAVSQPMDAAAVSTSETECTSSATSTTVQHPTATTTVPSETAAIIAGAATALPPPAADVTDQKIEFNGHQCCCCSWALLSTPDGALPAIVPRRLWLLFSNDREKDPAPGLEPAHACLMAWGMILKIISNCLFAGEARTIPVSGKTFSTKVGWDDLSRDIFRHLGFATTIAPDGREVLVPPDVKTPWPPAQQNRKMLCRAWLEIAAWYSEYRSKVFAGKDISPNKRPEDYLQLYPATDSLRDMAGITSSQLTQRVGGSLDRDWAHTEACEHLGATWDVSDELIYFAYVKRMEETRSRQEEWELFGDLEDVVTYRGGSDLQMFLASERSRGRLSIHEIRSAYGALGFNNTLGIDSDDHRARLPNDIVLDFYCNGARQAANQGRTEEVHRLQRALEQISLARGRPPELEKAKEARVQMEPERAYQALSVTRETDDAMVVMVYQIHVEDQPTQESMMREALRVIAEERDSAVLRRYLDTGRTEEDTWQTGPSASRPAGLNNIGNTCYLNSVLQYFFTIRELREVILRAEEVLEDEPMEGKEITKKVGGRLVTAREIRRSRKFVKLLAELFLQLIHTPAPAVTPARELAYLALVSSKTEEDDELAQKKEGGSPKIRTAPSTNSVGTSTTLVEEPGTLMTVASPASETGREARPRTLSTSSITVLGKRSASKFSESEKLDVSGIKIDSPTQSSEPVDNDSPKEKKAALDDGRSQTGPELSTGTLPTMDAGHGQHAATMDVLPSAAAGPSSSASKEPAVDTPSYEPFSNPRAPPLPPRPPHGAPISAGVNDAKSRSDSLMSLGAQQDVSECLDNVVFQIEAALDIEKVKMHLGEANANVVQRLFHGRVCQRLEVDASEGARAGKSVHRKEEIFTSLVVVVNDGSGRDLHDGLDSFFDDSYIETTEKGKHVRRAVTLLEAPPVLQIQLQRVQFDRSTSRAFKSQAHVTYPEQLALDRYFDVDPTDPANQHRLSKKRETKKLMAEIEQCRARLVELSHGKTSISQPIEDAVMHLSGLLADSSVPEIGLDPAFLASVSEEVKAIREDTKALEKRIEHLKAEIEELWKEDERDVYELASVFMHRGEATFGHYYLMQRNLPVPASPSDPTWFKYNDSTVAPVSLGEVLHDSTGANPYLLVYVRRENQMAAPGKPIVETVKRDLLEGMTIESLV